ncbi:Deoxyribodipyrimidine photo-lyase [Methanosalsum zhilinae DSM 4017]|uniref:Deoxyribodipyrimidine photo-lyase n=1 Tax=Methanosalsum zhilinae (strain DSM 4017 / NBRC 107636 / OCM 62 / WeN5) TaxID=679901 RepID=F7XLX4_METZD|nr:deoxyribodipyrimidine photo-lyase [Methanosalsum zhilinae]AEH60902.1 Deoxyribodipyrimidine photo-lyase [Methanosalsum zhilinae DSM 4017]
MRSDYYISLFIFRRDLRIDDNTALINALEQSDAVIPCFIFDPAQIKNNEYFSKSAFQFMIESLRDLKQQFDKRNSHLYLFYGDSTDVIRNLKHEVDPEAVFLNKDYTPFSKKRDSAIKQISTEYGMDFIDFHDLLLTSPDEISTDQGKPYSVYTPFFRKASKVAVHIPEAVHQNNYYTSGLSTDKDDLLPKMEHEYGFHSSVGGGRDNALAILADLSKFADYEMDRNYPSKETTRLSAHNKFGTVSIREVYHSIASELGPDHPLIGQLYWRDFFTHAAYHNSFVFGKSLREKFENIEWSSDNEALSRWCAGNTGFPIIDAGMRQLNITGYMHNRIRMITASFLVKDLHIDWKWGEKYFAQKLVDYDPCVNNGNWQWAASTGYDSQPYFRMFNPWSQQKKYDPECIYIKEWVQELNELDPVSIHNLETRRPPEKINYPLPMVDHSKERQITLEMYRSL